MYLPQQATPAHAQTWAFLLFLCEKTALYKKEMKKGITVMITVMTFSVRKLFQSVSVSD